MDMELTALIQEQFEDFVVKRADVAALALNSDREYLKVEARYDKLYKKLCEISTEKNHYAFEVDNIIGEIKDYQTVAAYKQGFKDAAQILKTGGLVYEFSGHTS